MQGQKIGIKTCLYLLCCILRIVKTKDLATIIAASLFCSPDLFVSKIGTTPNGTDPKYHLSQHHHQEDPCSLNDEANTESSGPVLSSAHHSLSQSNDRGSDGSLRYLLAIFFGMKFVPRFAVNWIQAV